MSERSELTPCILYLQECPSSHADPVEWLTAMILRRRHGPLTRLVSSISDDKDDDDFAELFNPMSFYSKFSKSVYTVNTSKNISEVPVSGKTISSISLENMLAISIYKHCESSDIAASAHC